MPQIIAGSIFALMIFTVLTRVMILRRKGIASMKFGKLDRKDFLIPPFALVLFYLLLSGVLHLPRLGSALFSNDAIHWIGAVLCAGGFLLFLWSIISFGKSFRVGIDEEKPGALITTGAFAVSRNPIYTAFAILLIGEFLTFPNWILLLYVFAGCWLFNRQVLREEASLKKLYGEDYEAYCRKVRRYL